MNLNFVFKSPDHLRYENGKHVSGPHGGAGRVIKVEPNINGGDGYSVTLFNLDGNHPIWQNNVQMAPKQMKVVQQSTDKITLKGYGSDLLGASFADYGLTIHFKNEEILKCTLHMYDRNVDIEYLKGDDVSANEPEVVSISRKANTQYQNNNISNGRQLLIQIYQIVKNDPAQLRQISDFSSIGKSFTIMLDEKLSDDIDTLQTIASVSYFCISKAIENDKNNLNLYVDRLLLLRIGHEPFKYTVMKALNLKNNPFSLLGQIAPMQARDAIYKMEIADIELHPQLYLQIPLFKERKNEFDEKINRQFFMPEKTLTNVIKSGVENHEKLLKYLSNKIFDNNDIDF